MEKSEIPEEVLNAMEDIKVQEKEKRLEGEILDISVKEIEKCEELERWKERVAKAEKQKNEMLIVKLNSDSTRKQYEDELTKLKEKKRVVQEDHQKDLVAIYEQNNILRKEIQFLQMKLAEEKTKYEEYVQGVQLKITIPEKKMNFVRSEATKNVQSCMNISCFIRVASKIPFRLSQGEALITFDEEAGRKVVQGLIQKHGHYVNIENKKKLVKAQPVTLGTGITFELQVHISGREVSVSNIPELNITEECMRDKLEVSLRRAKLGEVNHVAYDKKSQTALVTFDTAIANNGLMRYGQCPFHAHDRTYSITISPIVEMKLQDFQIYLGICRRTMLLTNIQVAEEDEETAEEIITIHFQKPSNGGGEVENVKYISNGSKIVYFENDQ